MSGLGQDVHYVLRMLRRSPGFTIVAVASLAIAVGSNAAIFGVVRTLLLTPLAVEPPQELKLLAWNREGVVRVNNIGSTQYRDETGGSLQSNFSYPMFRALGDAAPSGVRLFAFAFLRGVSVAAGSQPAFAAGGALVDGQYFSSLRVPMVLGRPILPADDASRAQLVAVLSHAFWMRSFGGDRSIVGRTVRVNGVTAEVIGVTGPRFQGLSMGGFFPQTEITLPLSAQPRVYRRLLDEDSLFTSDDTFWLRVMARVSSGTPLELAEQRFTATLRTGSSPLVGSDGRLPNVRLIDGSHGAQPVGPESARLLFFLVGVVAIVLLIACMNLAGLMLARGVSRQQEMAIRAALGGGRARLVRHTLLEALVLSAGGAATGLVLTMLGRNALRGLLTGSLGAGAFGDVDIQMSVDPVLFALAATLAAVAALASGLLPALRLSGANPIRWLTHRGSAGSAPHMRAARTLVAVQIAVSVPLVVGAVLFLRTLANLGSVQLGFDPKGMASFQVDPGYTHLPNEEYPRLYQKLLAQVQQVPGVRSATLVENAPLGGIVSNSSIDVDGRRVILYRNGIGPTFLETMGARLVEGRMPELQDGPGAPPVGVVNLAAVREVFGGRSPVGRMLRARGEEFQVVGVINDMPYRNRRDPVPPTLYQSAFQRSAWGGYHILLRTDAPVARLEAPLRAAVAEVDPDIPVPRIRAQAEIIAQSGARERVFTQLLTLFGSFALLIASIGLHGITSYAVARRTSEIGVRMAIGAKPGQVLWMVLRQVVMLAGIGLVVGVPAAIAGAPLIGSLLYGAAPSSPAAIAAAAAVMLAVAAGAGFVPALRAARLDPVQALRRE